MQAISNICCFPRTHSAPPKYADFDDFIKKNNLQDTLDFFGHSIEKDPNSQEPQLLVEGEKISWSHAKLRIFGLNPTSMQLPHGWKYNFHGFVPKNQVKWQVLESDWVDKVDPVAGRYFFEIVSNEQGVLGFGRHCWLRLIDKESRVISVGFCGKILKWLPLRAQKGKLVSPDPQEMDKGKKHVTRVEISEEQYQTLKQQIESDQKNQNFYFHMLTANCSTYTCSLLGKIGIDIQNTEYPTEALGRGISQRLSIRLPKCIVKALDWIAYAFRLVLGPVYQLGLFLLGAGHIDEDIRHLEKEKGHAPTLTKKPRFSMYFLPFDVKKFKFSTGWKVTEWQKCVSEDRIKKQMKLIKDEKRAHPNPTSEEVKAFDEKMHRAKYAFPPSFVPTPLGFERA